MKQLTTIWTHQVMEDPEHAWDVYPRPMMERDSFVCLNGTWQYAITTDRKEPKQYDGQILVPFSMESLLSGVQRQLMPDQYLWMKRKLPALEKDQRWLLHFGAVDQYCEVWINGQKLGSHRGGYLPFTFDVTDRLDNANEMVVMIRDESDQSYHSRGKQRLKRGGMWYTAQSGIWQTVWMEKVPSTYITDIRLTPHFDRRQLEVVVHTNKNPKEAVQIHLEGRTVHALSDLPVWIDIRTMHAWSPEDPWLYPLEIDCHNDHIKSYFAMRKIEVRKDKKGILRLFLNNRPYFQKGVLDQGYWPDGLYTAPCDQAMIFDIEKMKHLGFNMIRKHVKIEPQRWYYHCDRLGMLVWQDMVNGGRPYKFWHVGVAGNVLSVLHRTQNDHAYRRFGRLEKDSRREYIQEMKKTIHTLYNHPSIVTWVLFNEGWGQFDAKEVYKKAYRCDPTRTFDVTSGWFDQSVGDFVSIHNYFVPLHIQPRKRVVVLSEYGGYAWHTDHSQFTKEYGYKKFSSCEQLSKGYQKLIEKEILPNIPKGLSATVYTQISDVEEEVNGIYTYDRKLLKVEKEILIACHKKMTLEEEDAETNQ